MTRWPEDQPFGPWLDLLCGSARKDETVLLPVLSGSMMPALTPGGFVEVRPARWSDCRFGDIIVFRRAHDLTAHRLLFRRRRRGRTLLYQKGDALRRGGWIEAARVVGVIVRVGDGGGRLRDLGTPSARASAPLRAARQLVRALFWSLLDTPAGRRAKRWLKRRRKAAAAAEYRLEVGGSTVALTGLEAEQARAFGEYFGSESSSREPQVRLRLRVAPGRTPRRVPDSLFLEKRAAAGGFTIGGRLVRGRYAPSSGEGTLRVRPVLVGRLIRLFEQLLYQAYYSAVERSGEDAFLIHSSGVIRGGEGFLFVGGSGAGKSTAARLSRSGRPGCRVLNDEVCLLRLDGERVILQGTPFNGFFSGKEQGSAPLRAVFLLAQAQHHRIAGLDRAEAALRLYAQIVPPMGLDGTLTAQTRARMLDLAGRLVDRVAVRRLEFLPDPGFWEQIDGMFPRARS